MTDLESRLAEKCYIVKKSYGFISSQESEMLRIMGVDKSLLANNKATISLPILVSEQWVSGGKRGGNCWGDSADELVIADDPPTEFAVLDELLELVCPNITYLQYRKLQKHIHRVEYTEYEYYGNYTAQSFMYILHSDLLAVLKDLNNDQ